MDLSFVRHTDGTLATRADGGYPLYYICQDGGILCPKCANENAALSGNTDDPQWNVIAYDVNWEDENLLCDHCGGAIMSAYGEED